MGKAILTNVRIFAGAVDITGQTNRLEVAAQSEIKNVTTFGSVDPATGQLWQDNLSGLDSASLQVGGFNEAGGGSFVDDDMWANFGGTGPWSILPGTSTDGSLAYLINAVRASYTLGDAVGEVYPFAAAASSTGPFARGAVLLNPGTARTATGTGGVVNIGAVPAGRAMRASLHVVSVAGTTPTFAAVLQSAALVGFGSPTTRATFATVNGPAGNRTAEYVASAAGPITDAFWRISYTITGTGPSFLALSVAGIG
jgi:hypothetical protein